MDIYRDILMDHYNNPANVGRISKATHTGCSDNILCGDKVKLDLVINEGLIRNVKHQSEGCAVAVASASLISQELQNIKVSKTSEITLDYLLDLLGTKLTTSRQQCARVVLDALRDALK